MPSGLVTKTGFGPGPDQTLTEEDQTVSPGHVGFGGWSVSVCINTIITIHTFRPVRTGPGQDFRS